MWAVRQSLGTTPSSIDLLKIHVIGVQSSSARFFRILGGISSGPAALDESSFSSFFFTVSSSISILTSFSLSGPLYICVGVGTSESSLVKTEVRKLLRVSAVSCPGCKVTQSSPTASLTFCLIILIMFYCQKQYHMSQYIFFSRCKRPSIEKQGVGLLHCHFANTVCTSEKSHA